MDTPVTNPRMIRHLLVGMALMIGSLNQVAAQATVKNDFASNAIGNFQQLTKIPYEKLYLHLDKPYYSVGENIWYSSYLVDGVTTKLSPLSRYIYVELRNNSDSIVQRQKIMKDSLGLTGNFHLPLNLTPGDYNLRAYSWWMQNSGSEYFFQRTIHVGNAIDKSIDSSVNYKMAADNQMNADIAFTSDKHFSFAGRKVNYRIYQGDKLLRVQNTCLDSHGHIQLGFKFDSGNNILYKIYITFDDPTYIYSRTFLVPCIKAGFDVQFFPEGGNLLNNGFRKVAFKALGENGLSVEVEGTLYNQKGDSITSFRSQHKGMGLFPFLLDDHSPMKYYAKVHLQGSKEERTFNLPDVRNSGVEVTLLMHNDRIFYHLIAADKKQVADKKMYLLTQQRGKLQTILSITDTLQWNGNLRQEMFMSGIVHFMLLDEAGNALSERLAFIDQMPKSSIRINADKESYSRRAPVKLGLSLENAADSIAVGKFSIAITEDKTVKNDSLADNICSSLLLTSDLKGNIEDPGFYFNTYNRIVDPNIDLVMLTHGWTRFDIPSILKGNLPENKYPLEQGQYISGKIKGVFGGAVKNAQLIMFAPKIKYSNAITTNEKGEFLVDGLMFPDSTAFLIQALSKKGRKTVELQLDKSIFPAFKLKTLFPETTIKPYIDDYMNVMSQKFYYEGGEKVYRLKEVLVTANRKKQEDQFTHSELGHPIKSKEIQERFSNLTALEILRYYPGIEFSGDRILMRKNKTSLYEDHSPALIIDGIIYYRDDFSSNDPTTLTSMLSSIFAEDIACFNVIGGPQALSIEGGMNGIIAINLKNGLERIAERATPGRALIRPLGYYKPNQFYAPKYETDQQIKNPNPDLRTTIYWNPSIILNRNKAIQLKFFTADNPGQYTVTLEGVTNTGELVHNQTKIKVKE